MVQIKTYLWVRMVQSKSWLISNQEFVKKNPSNLNSISFPSWTKQRPGSAFNCVWSEMFILHHSSFESVWLNTLSGVYSNCCMHSLLLLQNDEPLCCFPHFPLLLLDLRLGHESSSSSTQSEAVRSFTRFSCTSTTSNLHLASIRRGQSFCVNNDSWLCQKYVFKNVPTCQFS